MNTNNFNRFSVSTVKNRKVISQDIANFESENVKDTQPQKENNSGQKQKIHLDSKKDKSIGTDIFNLPKSDFEKMNTTGKL